jgi:hypothetical protein
MRLLPGRIQTKSLPFGLTSCDSSTVFESCATNSLMTNGLTSSRSCTSWSVTYAAASQAARRMGLGASLVLSPAFTHNVVSGDRSCQRATSISKTLDLLRDQGALPLEEFLFDPGWCGRQPTDAERKRAARYRIKAWSRFDAKDIDAVKAQLARGAPVIFGMSCRSEAARPSRRCRVQRGRRELCRARDDRGRLRRCHERVPHPEFLGTQVGRRRLRVAVIRFLETQHAGCVRD